MNFVSNVKSVLRLVATAGIVALPILPTLVSLVLRGAECWKLWHTMARFPAVETVAGVWVIAYLVASLITVLQLDDEMNLRRLEHLIDIRSSLINV